MARGGLAVMLVVACSGPAVTPDAGVSDDTLLADELVITGRGL